MTGQSFHQIWKECWDQRGSVSAMGSCCWYHAFAIMDLKSGVWQNRAMSLFTYIQMGNWKYTTGYTFQMRNCKRLLQGQSFIDQQVSRIFFQHRFHRHNVVQVLNEVYSSCSKDVYNLITIQLGCGLHEGGDDFLYFPLLYSEHVDQCLVHSRV